MRPLPPCSRCGTPAPESPIPTGIEMGGAVFYSCSGCDLEQIIPWGRASIQLIEEAREVVRRNAQDGSRED